MDARDSNIFLTIYQVHEFVWLILKNETRSENVKKNILQSFITTLEFQRNVILPLIDIYYILVVSFIIITTKGISDTSLFISSTNTWAVELIK